VLDLLFTVAVILPAVATLTQSERIIDQRATILN
jgi:hypothetical protein